MFRSARFFTPKNRRTSLQMTSFRLPDQPVEDRVRVLRQQWADFLVLPTCLVLLALYEWWRWLFSIPANPFLLTIVAAVALTQMRRRRKLYRAELNQLQFNRKAPCTARQLIELLRSEAQHLRQDLVDRTSIQTIPGLDQRVWQPFKRICDAGLCVSFPKSLLAALLSELKRHAPWPNR